MPVPLDWTTRTVSPYCVDQCIGIYSGLTLVETGTWRNLKLLRSETVTGRDQDSFLWNMCLYGQGSPFQLEHFNDPQHFLLSQI